MAKVNENVMENENKENQASEQKTTAPSIVKVDSMTIYGKCVLEMRKSYQSGKDVQTAVCYFANPFEPDDNNLEVVVISTSKRGKFEMYARQALRKEDITSIPLVGDVKLNVLSDSLHPDKQITCCNMSMVNPFDNTTLFIKVSDKVVRSGFTELARGFLNVTK